MPARLKRAARYRAHAVSCLNSAEAAPDSAQRRPLLAVAQHFYLLAQEQIDQFEQRRGKPPPGPRHPPPDPNGSQYAEIGSVSVRRA
jgi:hypothetical protein